MPTCTLRRDGVAGHEQHDGYAERCDGDGGGYHDPTRKEPGNCRVH
ncbi:MAG: hypothetical protein U0800_22715 [Isosphaeraceae bacterium]